MLEDYPFYLKIKLHENFRNKKVFVVWQNTVKLFSEAYIMKSTVL